MDTREYKKQYTEICQELFRRFAKAGRRKNIVFSPTSIIAILAIAADATDGKTREEILRLLCGRRSYDDVRPLLLHLMAELTNDKALASANALIVKDAFRQNVKKTYEDMFRSEYNGEIFSSPNIGADLDAWVKEKTLGMIDKMSDAVSKHTLFAFVNAIAFYAKWQEPYEQRDLSMGCFHNGNRSRSKVIMLQSMENHYIETKEFTGFLKPYSKVGYSYMALLPKSKRRISSADYLAKIDFPSLYESARVQDVRVKMPEFEYTFGGDVTGVLADLGIRRVFSNHADFKPFSDKWLKVEGVYHKAFIHVDRSGTKAAAVTVTLCAGGAEFLNTRPKKVILDRPFVYAIIHDATGLPVFIGTVDHISSTTEEMEPFRPETSKPDEEYNDECRKIYRKAAKMLHPDLNSNNVPGSREEELFGMLYAAYCNHELEILREIEEEANDLARKHGT